MDIHSLTTLGQMISSAISATKSAREIAKDSSDSALKEKISEIYDCLLELKERALDLSEENTSLKNELAAKALYDGPVPPFSYFYRAGDRDHPLCPKCFQEKQQRLSFLGAPESWNGGVRRNCPLCNFSNFEKPMSHRQPQIKTYL